MTASIAPYHLDRRNPDGVLGKVYDPSDPDDYESLLLEYNIHLIEDRNELGNPVWSFHWPNGAYGQFSGNRDDAKLQIALWCYLWLKGVDCGVARDLSYFYWKGVKK